MPSTPAPAASLIFTRLSHFFQTAQSLNRTLTGNSQRTYCIITHRSINLQNALRSTPPPLLAGFHHGGPHLHLFRAILPSPPYTIHATTRPILLAEPALLVWHGPARSLDYKKHPHMLKRIYIPSSCGILLSLGRLVDLMFGSTQAELQRNIAGTVVHALLAFAYIGLVEPIRQNASIPLPPSSLAVARGD